MNNQILQRILSLGVVLIGLLGASVGIAQESRKNGDIETGIDRVAALRQRLALDEAHLEYDPDHGYLRSLLDELKIDVTSQTLVFSKTSLQHQHINRFRPRAIYFNDDTYIGWVQGGERIELASVDGKTGTIFYTLDQSSKGRPQITRNDSCLRCHETRRTLDVPGPVVRSIYPDDRGHVVTSAGGFTTDHRSPLAERWGGWYVSGLHGGQKHMGNAIVKEPEAHPTRLARKGSDNVTDLSKYFGTRRYLTPHSDIVALLVLEHQTHMQNLLTSGHQIVSASIERDLTLNPILGLPVDQVTDRTRQRIEEQTESILRYMLMIDEVIFDEPIEGTSGFTESFSDRGPKDSKGRSLYQLNLKKYLFRYQCSYMIYSPGFDQMHPLLREHLYRRLYKILTGADQSAPWSRLSRNNNRAILSILRETKPNLPSYFFNADTQPP